MENVSLIGQRILGAIGRKRIVHLSMEWGVSSTTIHAWISGRTLPRHDHLALIAAKTGVPIETLYNDICQSYSHRNRGYDKPFVQPPAEKTNRRQTAAGAITAMIADLVPQ